MDGGPAFMTGTRLGNRKQKNKKFSNYGRRVTGFGGPWRHTAQLAIPFFP